jgi:pimeloyl-ACP methyl ester carboxylesterase
MRCIARFPSLALAVFCFAFGGSIVLAVEIEPPEVRQARELIRNNGRSVAYFALPTYKYLSTGYNEYRQLSDGYELIFTFETKSHWRSHTTRMAFYFDSAGQFDYCKSLRSTTHYTPFQSAVGKKELAKLRAFMAEHPAVRDSRRLLKKCDEADARGLCELFLRLEQARMTGSAERAESPRANGKERLDAMFVQVAPVPPRPAEFERSAQTRAVVLVHGYRPEFDRFRTARAVVQDWQEPESLMVQVLKRDADVFAFAYGQNVAVQQVAEAPELAAGVARLKKLGYTDVVLLGYSAGGVICRQFVEDHADAGVTKVVQVCAPNAGVFLAKFAALACSTQRAYIHSLTAASRRQAQQDRGGTAVPADVEFVCVVGDVVARSDWLVKCKSQWSDDLQSQGIPAVRVRVSHLAAVEQAESILAIARAVREPAPRWDRQQVQLVGHEMLKK